MRSSIAPVLLWSCWANIIYFLGMIGYLIMDVISPSLQTKHATFVCSSYVVLTVIFIIDALLYTIDWYFYAVKLRKNPTDPIEYRCELAACVFQIVGSFFYVLGAIYACRSDRLTQMSLNFNLLGIIALLIESILTLIGWWIVYQRTPLIHPHHGCSIANIYLWAHGLNIAASIIYLVASLVALDFSSSLSVFLLQIIGDLVYLIDAYLYHRCWLRDKKEFDANSERENLIKLQLAKLSNPLN